MKCRLCDSKKLVSILDLAAPPPCEKFLNPDELGARHAGRYIHPIRLLFVF